VIAHRLILCWSAYIFASDKCIKPPAKRPALSFDNVDSVVDLIFVSNKR